MRVQTQPLAGTPAVLNPVGALPAEWDDWAEEPAHQVIIEDSGVPVGALHVALVSATEAWLEGLRVRADRQGGGIGRRLVAEGEALARRYGAGVARTAIPAHDYAAQQVAERGGFRPLARAVVHEASLGPGPLDVPYGARVREAQVAESGAISEWLGAGETFQAWQGLMPLGWRFRQSVPHLIKGLVKDRRVLRAGESLEGVVCFTVRRGAAVISVLEGNAAALPALVGGVAVRAQEQGAERLVFFVSDERALRPVRLDHRPHSWCPDGLVIVEKTLRS